MKKLFSCILTVALCIACLNIPAFAAKPTPYATEKNGTITFHNLDQVGLYERVAYETVDHEGNPATVSIQRVPSKTRSSTTTWLISGDALAVDCEYYIDVTDDQIVNAYCWSIFTTLYDYSDVSLTYSPSMSVLSFKASLDDWYHGTCWLSATIRGQNNEVDVQYSC